MPTLTVDRASGVPVSRQIYERIREAILTGQLGPGLRLPSTRQLAAELGVSRTTTLAAYERLRHEGYLDGLIGSGTTVALLQIHPPVQPSASNMETRREAGELSAQGAGVAGVRWQLRSAGRFPAFPVGQPAFDAFPAQLWGRVVARRARSVASLLRYQHPAGDPALREAIAAYLGMARGVRCTADRVLVVSGAQAGLSLAARMLLDPGDGALVEDPGYYGARGAVVAAGGVPVPIPVGSNGFDVSAAPPGARLAFVTPSHQFPLGVTMSLPRRLALLRWAATVGGYVVEDDYDSEYRYAGDPLPSLQGLDTAGRVVYVGSFSKVLFPALRIGYLVVPDGLVDAFAAGHRFAAGHAPALEQAALADFIAAGHFARHIRRMRALYAERGAVLAGALRRELDGLVSVSDAEAGLHLVGWLPDEVDDAWAAARAAQNGVDTQALSAHAMQPYGRNGLLLGYAATPQREIVAGVRRLAAALG
ncbi:MAG TPA: PLP-dependent aminotransferase family protein [Candidatus Limnocylindrales bacterium]